MIKRSATDKESRELTGGDILEIWERAMLLGTRQHGERGRHCGKTLAAVVKANLDLWEKHSANGKC